MYDWKVSCHRSGLALHHRRAPQSLQSNPAVVIVAVRLHRVSTAARSRPTLERRRQSRKDVRRAHDVNGTDVGDNDRIDHR